MNAVSEHYYEHQIKSLKKELEMAIWRAESLELKLQVAKEDRAKAEKERDRLAERLAKIAADATLDRLADKLAEAFMPPKSKKRIIKDIPKGARLTSDEERKRYKLPKASYCFEGRFHNCYGQVIVNPQKEYVMGNMDPYGYPMGDF